MICAGAAIVDISLLDLDIFGCVKAIMFFRRKAATNGFMHLPLDVLPSRQLSLAKARVGI